VITSTSLSSSAIFAFSDPRRPLVSTPLPYTTLFRSRLGGDLGVARERDQGAQVLEHRDQVVRGQQGGGASAEEHGRDLLVLVPGLAVGGEDQSHLPLRVVRVLGLGSAAAELGGGVGVEVAVPAAHRAEGDVDVDGQRLHRPTPAPRPRPGERSRSGKSWSSPARRRVFCAPPTSESYSTVPVASAQSSRSRAWRGSRPRKASPMVTPCSGRCSTSISSPAEVSPSTSTRK